MILTKFSKRSLKRKYGELCVRQGALNLRFLATV